MAIKFNCPHCKRPFNVKDNLAGLRRACPGCKKMLTVPAPTSAPASLEEFAAAALADQPEQDAAPPKEVETVEFVCSYCDAKVQVAAGLAGKQTSCPECRRIVKVPLPKKADPKDWRKVDMRLPAGARRDVEPAPEGAWDARAVGAVSREALLEADAVPQVKPKRTWKQWTRIGATAGAFLAVVTLIILFISNYQASRLQGRLLGLALDGLEGSKDPLASAELYRAAGTYLLLGQTPNAVAASSHFKSSRHEALQPATEAQRYERDCLLTDLLLAQAELGGTPEEAQQNKRLKWNNAQNEMRQTCQNLRVPEARAEALVLITRELAKRAQTADGSHRGSEATGLPPQDRQISRSWAALFPEQMPELLSVLGLEILRVSKDPKDVAEAQMLAEQASQPFQARPGASPAPPPKKPALPPASLIALWLVLNKPDHAQKLLTPQEQGKPPDAAVAIGTAEALALQGNWPQVIDAIQHVPEPDQLTAWVAVAAVAVDLPDSGKANDCLEKAFAAAAAHPKPEAVSPWLLYRLVRLSVMAGMEEKALTMAKQIPDADLRGRAQLAVLRKRLEKANQSMEASHLEIVDKSTPAHGLALEAWARHNARFGGTAVQKSVDAWPSETDRRFGYLGMLLGLQDGSGKR